MQSRPLCGRAAAVVAIGAVVTAGCGSNRLNSRTNGAVNTSASQRSTTFNSTDVTFARDYLTEQSQEQTAAALLAHRTDHVQLFIVVGAIERRSRDIEDVYGWLHDWNKPVSTSPPYRNLSGVMTSHDIEGMARLRGTRFDEVWLGHMAANDAATIASCENEVSRGLNHLALRLAGLRWGVLRAELAKLQHWLAAWSVHEPHNY